MDFLNEADLVKFIAVGSYGIVFAATKGPIKRALKISTVNEDSYWEAYLGSYFTSHLWKWGYEGNAVPAIKNRSGEIFKEKESDLLLNMMDYVNFYTFTREEQGYLQRAILGILRGGTFIEKNRKKVWEQLDWKIAKNETVYLSEIEMLNERAWDIFIEPKNQDAYDQMTSMLIQILSTLREISRSNPAFIHGDLKISNIMVKILSSTDASLTYPTSEENVSLVDETRSGEFLLYVIIDYGFSRSDIILSGLRQEFSKKALEIVKDTRSPDEKLSLLDYWAQNVFPFWDSDDFEVTQSKSMDLHLIGMDILLILSIRISREEEEFGVIKDIDRALDFADFAVEYLLHSSTALTQELVRVVGRNYLFKPHFVLGYFKIFLRKQIQIIHKLKTDKEKADLLWRVINVSYQDIKIPTRAGPKTLGQIATSRIQTTNKIMLDIRYFLSKGQANTQVELQESQAANANFWEHKIFNDYRRTSIKRKVEKEEEFPVVIEPLKRKTRRLEEVDPNIPRPRFIRLESLRAPPSETLGMTP
jgi:serine/threonine protein kinase